MKETCTLKKLVQIKVMANALRMQLLEAFCHKPMTTKQIAQLLGKPPTKLYHHVAALEQAGLIALVKTQRKRGTVEKYYRTVAHRFSVDRKLLELKPRAKETISEIQTVVTKMLENTLSEIKKSIAEKLITPKNKRIPTVLAHSYISATPYQIKRLCKKIEKILKECHTVRHKQGTVKYGLTLAFYPIKKKQTRGKKVGRK